MHMFSCPSPGNTRAQPSKVYIEDIPCMCPHPIMQLNELMSREGCVVPHFGYACAPPPRCGSCTLGIRELHIRDASAPLPKCIRYMQGNKYTSSKLDVHQPREEQRKKETFPEVLGNEIMPVIRGHPYLAFVFVLQPVNLQLNKSACK